MTKEISYMSDQFERDIEDLVGKMRFLTNWFLFLVTLGPNDAKKFKDYLTRILKNFATNRFADKETSLEKYLQEQKTKFESGIPGISKKEKEVRQFEFNSYMSKLSFAYDYSR